MPLDFDLLRWLWNFAVFGIVAAAVCAAGGIVLLIWLIVQFV